MATVPLSGTDIRFLSGVPFSNDYKHTRWFDDSNSQFNWFYSIEPEHIIASANFEHIEDRTFIAVNKSIDELRNVNYLMFRNSAYNNKWFYCFVTNLQYVQKNTTYVHVQLDVVQTWRFEMNFKPSFVIREHCPLWNADGSPVINTVDEGLNYGTDYQVKAIENITPIETKLMFLVIISKTAIHYNSANVNYSTVNMPINNGLPQPLSYYIVPFRVDGTIPHNIVVGTDTTIIGDYTLHSLLYQIYATAPADNIVSMYVSEYIGFNPSYDSTSDTITFLDTQVERVSIGGTGFTDPMSAFALRVKDATYYSDKTITFTDKYSEYDSVTESKLLMYPYTVLYLDDFKGNRVTLKNEYINSNDIVVNIKGSMGTSNKVSYNVNNYLLNPSLPNAPIAELENALINNSVNDIPVLSNYLTAYMQGHKNTIENQKSALMFNGMADMVGNTIGGVASGSAGNFAGVANSGLGIIKGMGNTAFQIQGIEANIKDISNIPPSLVKLGGNANFDYGNFLFGAYLVKKQITPEYQKKLSDFFNMFGYKKNEVKVPNFHTRQSWNYVQTSSCNIIGSFNNEDLQELKNVFDGGICLWHTDDIGNYSLGNGVI